MEHTTPTDITALLAEVDAIEAEHTAMQARVDALLTRGSAAALLADCQAMAEMLARDTAVQTRYQRRIARAIDAL
jgi:hypothetical protein